MKWWGVPDASNLACLGNFHVLNSTVLFYENRDRLVNIVNYVPVFYSAKHTRECNTDSF